MTSPASLWLFLALMFFASENVYVSSEKEPPGGLTVDYKLLEKETRTLLCERQQDLKLTLNSTHFLDAFGKYLVEIADKLSNTTKLGMDNDCSIKGLLFPRGAPNYKWVKGSGQTLPNYAVNAGAYGDYIGRLKHGEDILPAIVHSFDGNAKAFAPGINLIKKNEFEVLSSDGISWEPTNSKKPIPGNAFVVGRIKEDNRRLYMGRSIAVPVSHGKVETGDRLLKVGYANKEWTFSDYEILVKNSSHSQYRWVKSKDVNGIVPQDAVLGGYDIPSGYELYVGRSWHDNNLLPSKIAPYREQHDAHITLGGIEIWIHNFEYLITNDVSWVPMNSKDNIPSKALQAGHTSSNEPLYVGRTKTPLWDEQRVGTVDPIDGCLHIPYRESREIRICNNFEIMGNKCMKSADTF